MTCRMPLAIGQHEHMTGEIPSLAKCRLHMESWGKQKCRNCLFAEAGALRAETGLEHGDPLPGRGLLGGDTPLLG